MELLSNKNKTLHDIQWDSAEVLERESNLYMRKFKEALHIKDENSHMNLDQGFQINPIWSTLQITWLISDIIMITSSHIMQ